MRIPLLFLAAVLATLALVAVGCGGDDDSGGGGGGGGGGSAYSGGSSKQSSKPASNSTAGGTQLKLTADPGGDLKFDKTSLSAKPGKVTITMDNPSQVPHAVEVEGNGVEKETKTVMNSKASVTVDLKKGSYEFYCPVDGHRQAGMEGKLTVG